MKRNIFILLSAVFILSGCSKSKKNAGRVPAIGFYGIPEETVTTLKEQISTVTDKFKFVTLDSSKELTYNTTSQYSIVFLYNGKLADKLSAKTADISPEALNQIPTNFRQNKKLLPLIVDHYEVSYYRPENLKTKLNSSLPGSLGDMKNYLSKAGSVLEVPSVCAGKTDDELLGLISNVAINLLGEKKYLELANEISSASADEMPSDLRTVLEEIKMWQNNGLILKNWYEVSENDILRYYIPERNTGTVFMSLSLHRKVQDLYINYFDTERFPAKDNSYSSGLIAPALCALKVYEDTEADKVLSFLINEQTQELLSDKTLLAPANSRSYSHDRQSSDVRFWAAQSAYGPMAHLGKTAFSDPAKIKAFAKSIRIFLSL